MTTTDSDLVDAHDASGDVSATAALLRVLPRQAGINFRIGHNTVRQKRALLDMRERARSTRMAGCAVIDALNEVNA